MSDVEPTAMAADEARERFVHEALTAVGCSLDEYLAAAA